MKPWDKQKNIKEIADKDRPQTMKEIIGIGLDIKDDRTRSLFFLLYLTGGRICEIVRKYQYNLQKLGIEKTEVDGKIKRKYLYDKIRTGETLHALRGKDIEIVKEGGRDVLLLHLRNEKHRKNHQKIIPIPLDLDETIIMYNNIKNYINSIQQDEELFPFGYQYAYRLLKGFFNPHWFRHLRATHLVTTYGFNESQLRTQMGWSDSRPAGIYVSLNWRDVLSGY